MRDLKDQFQTITKMGSFSKILEMLPNSRALIDQMENEGNEGSEKDKKENLDKKLKKLIVLVDSMNEKELDYPSNYWEDMAKNKKEELLSRKKRIARGAGVTVKMVDELFEQYSLFGKMLRVTSGLEGKKGQKQLEKMAKSMGSKTKRGNPSMKGLGDLKKMQGFVQQMQSAMKGKGGIGSLAQKMMKGEGLNFFFILLFFKILLKVFFFKKKDPLGLQKGLGDLGLDQLGGLGDLGGLGGLGNLGGNSMQDLFSKLGGLGGFGK